MKPNIFPGVLPWGRMKSFHAITGFRGTVTKLDNKKKTILLFFVLLFSLTGWSQQLSYAYDAAGNRISRTIVVGAYHPSGGEQHDSSRFYVENIHGRELSIHVEREKPGLTIQVSSHDSLLEGTYTLSDKNDDLLTGDILSDRKTRVELEEVPPGTYTLHILVNDHSSEWELIKL
ncbi:MULTISPECIES: hypothetical protein [Proteiniphilum]|uniref:hypothetical protein n=1 Tax=Proteiniphilum TaxID=294702 RepID=UPI001EEA125B|nr:MULTISPECIES: hypothetical protein [Proteiniphilum]ULB34941.1 hypothetical protein KDN43_02485 [Proteiniphilum propionicum]